MQLLRYTLLVLLISFYGKAYSNQDMDLHVSDHYLAGKKIIKVFKNQVSPIVWILGDNNQVYKLNSTTKVLEDLSSLFVAYHTSQFVDIVCLNDQKLFIATKSNVLMLENGVVAPLVIPDLSGEINSLGLYANSNYFSQVSNKNALYVGNSNGLAKYGIEDQSFIQPANDGYAQGRVYECNYRSVMVDFGLHPYNIPDNNALSVVTSGAYGGSVLQIWRNGKYGQPITAFYEDSPELSGLDTRQMSLYWGSETGLFASGFNFAQMEAQTLHFLDGIKVNKVNNIYGLTSFYGGYKRNLLVGTDNGLYFSESTAESFYSPPRLELTHLDALGNIPINDIETDITSITKLTNYVVLHLVDCESGAWLATNDGLYFVKPDYGNYIDPQLKIDAINFTGQSSDVASAEICAGTSVTANVSGDLTANSIQWYKNGLEIPAQSSAELPISQPGEYYTVLYDPCSGIHLESNHLKVNVISSPIFTFNYADVLQYCDGSTATLKAEGSDAYQYRWYKDGVLNGKLGNSLSVSQNGKYKVEVSACNGNWVPSKEVQVNFIQLPQPKIAPDKAFYCIGQPATLSLNVPKDPSYTIKWLNNGVPVNTNNNKTSLTTNVAGVYSATLSSTNLNTCSQTSDGFILTFAPAPTLSISQIVNTTLCSGQVVSLKASYTNGTVTWSIGSTTDKIDITTSGDYFATVKTPAGCEVIQYSNVQFFNNPVLNMADATLCNFEHEQITLTAPNGFSKYVWNGVAGAPTFTTGALGIVTLTVTDQNGCTASQEIHISSHCNEIKMANTFTPNGDNINDTWLIAGLDNDPSATIKVFNRYGNIIFESRGYSTPWNGESKGKKLPTGVYYYIINARNNTQILSGSITIIY